MDYYPSKHEIELGRFFAYRSTALRKLEKLGLSCPYISATFTYEQLYLIEVELDFNTDEDEFLKKAIVCVFDCLKGVERQNSLTRAEVTKKVRLVEKDRIESYKAMSGFSKKRENEWVLERVEKEIESENRSIEITKIALSKELAELRMRLGRRSIKPQIIDNKIEFPEQMHVLKPLTENPYPEIFRDGNAFVLFGRLHSVFKNTTTQRADYGFIYWKMWNDGFIINKCKPEKFRTWIGEEAHNITTSAPFRTLLGCTTQHKEDLYNTLKSI